MLQIAAPLFEQNLIYARKLVADLNDYQMTTHMWETVSSTMRRSSSGISPGSAISA